MNLCGCLSLSSSQDNINKVFICWHRFLYIIKEEEEEEEEEEEKEIKEVRWKL
jgi:hypothetical protein